MDKIYIERWGYTPYGTFGTLSFQGFQCHSLERHWMNNWRGVSCILPGIYEIEHTTWRERGVLSLLDVPGRTEILNHPANLAVEMDGCIAPGLGLQVIDDSLGIARSVDALESLLCELEGFDIQDIRLVIRERISVTSNYGRPEERP